MQEPEPVPLQLTLGTDTRGPISLARDCTKELSRLACAGSNFLFFRGQRNRWVPHTGLLQVGGARFSSTYTSTATPIVSILSELLSKQLISVLGGDT